VQAQCPSCSTRIQINDGKVPDRPFKVKCPKCQSVITLPGKGADVAAPPEAAAGPAPAPAGAPPPTEPLPLPSPADLARRERAASSPNDALVALAGSAAGPLQQALVALGFNVDLVDDVEEGARLLEQGIYEVAVTARTPPQPGKPESLAQRMLRLPIDTRRRIFVVLVGDEFRTGDGTQAWAVQADLVVNPADASRCEHLVRATLAERQRLYQPFLDARRRIESE
jgi:predicted Zn finger-like uncharacterized protein